MNPIDAAARNATALIEDVATRIGAVRTEEDAKIQLITRFLIEVLGWSFADLSAERRHDNGFSDYVLNNQGRPAILVEAKRIGELGIATTATSKQNYKISGPALKPSLSGIEQAASYCQPEGIQLAVVTDGCCWVFFKPSIPDEPYKSKEAIVFPTLQSILDDFAIFYELASKSSSDTKTYKIIFDRVHQNRYLVTKRLEAIIPDAEIKPEQKHPIAFDLDKIFDVFFSGLTGEADPDLLIECFVETKESRIADFSLEKLTTNVLGNIDPSNRHVDDALRAVVDEAISSDAGETIFVVGPSGSGKTTFLDRFFKKTLSQQTRAKCIVISINLLDAPGDTASSPTWLIDKIIAILEKQLYDAGFPNWDQLLGLYHLEYLKRINGVDAILYQRDKDAFKQKFSEYMERQVELDRDGYLRRLLTNIVQSRKLLPIFVVDNSDEFSLGFKQQTFQFFQSLRRHAVHCLLIFPATDRSAWSFSKTEIFNIYASRSFFLPTPSPKEVLKKRISYLKKKTELPSGTTKGSYQIGKSFRVDIGNLERFKSAIEDVFVDQDYVSKRIGALANYNIRKTLGLARRIMTSASIKIEDLFGSYVLGAKATLPPERVMLALLRGDSNYYRRGDSHSIFPVFDVDEEIRQSPLLNLRVLTLLKAIHDGATIGDARYIGAHSVIQYFDAIGYGDIAVEKALSNLASSGLIEPYDASVSAISTDQRIAITHSGLAHFELAVFNSVVFEQLALTTRLADPEVAAVIRAKRLAVRANFQQASRVVREAFAAFILEEDRRFGSIPDGEIYAIQRSLDADLARFADGNVILDLFERDGSGRTLSLGERKTAIVDWFDADKGYGFVSIDGLDDGAFLHASVVESSNVAKVYDGDVLTVDLTQSAKGTAVSKVHNVTRPNTKTVNVMMAVVVKVFPDRGYGFVHVPEMKSDAFFHVSVVPNNLRSGLQVGSPMRVELNADPNGRGYQVRRVIVG